MAETEKLTLQQLHDLRAALPDLDFNINTIKEVPSPLLAEEYLSFYGINFDNQYFHRWGRVMVPCTSPGTHGWTIACHFWLPTLEAVLPEKGMVMVVHGYFDHVGLYGHLFKYLLELGYGVVAFDLPGHGLSSGEPASIATFDHYSEVFDFLCDQIRQHFPVPLSAIGQSTGGAIILKHLTTGHTDLARVTLLAPLVEPALWGLNKFVYVLTHRFRKGVKRVFMPNSSDKAFVEFVKNDPLQAKSIPLEWVGAMKLWIEEFHAAKPSDYPITVIQGGKDTTVAWRGNLKVLAKKFPKATFVMVDDASHHLVNEVESIRKQVFGQMSF